MFEQTFKNIDDVLWKEAGCTTELDYTEQTSWILFLKYLDDLEQGRAMEAELVGKPYAFIIDAAHKWSKWAAPKKANGTFNHDNALTGDDLIDYVNRQLFPYLQGFKQRATSPDTIEYKIGEIFSEIKNRFQSGYSLRDALELIDELRFQSQKEKHELSHLYEAKIKNMGNAGRNGGEYYTPRPLIRAMIKVTKPKIGERIYDGALGSGGFLCEAYEYLRRGELTTSQLKTLQTRTFYGKEKKSLAYVIATMNMILHGIDAPNIVHTNTLAENLSDVQEKDRFDVILANPPFGGKERPEVQQNFPIKTGETAFLFLQHFIKHLKAGGRAAIVIKNTFLSNSDGAARALRQELLESCSLHTVLDCPGGTFQGAGVKTVVLFFEKGSPTRKVWYYQLDPGRNMGKTNALNDNDLKEFVALQARFADSDKSWAVDVSGIDLASFDLSVKNPNKAEEEALRDPQTAQKITPEGAKKSRRVDEGDFILTNSMSFGRPYIMKTSGYIHDGWFVLRLNDTIDSEYFYYLLSSSFVQSQFAQLASGSVVKNISGDLVKKAVLPIPPLAQQQVIVSQLLKASSETTRLEAIYQQKVSSLERLRQAILQKAFAGKLIARSANALPEAAE